MDTYTQMVELLEELHTAALSINKSAAKAALKPATAKVAKDTTKAGQRAALVTALTRWRMEQQQQQQSKETDENAPPCNRQQPNTTVITPVLPPRSLMHVHGQQLPKGVVRRVATASEKKAMGGVSRLSPLASRPPMMMTMMMYPTSIAEPR